MAPSILLRNEEEGSVTDAGLSVLSGLTLDNDVDLSGLDDAAPVMIW